MDEIMLRIDHVSKQYILGQIGGTTLRDELQRVSARIRGKEDPTRMIGAGEVQRGDLFLALNEVSFDVRKGERVGIIGQNGAGKSTLLKLISRVTAPTSGQIGLNGRVASMLEVGTGFHPELTGRENIYMNGAILGMKKKEIDAKIEDIIEFSECRPFIDTPVKRYSSGMYVKLAFSVAAHLDSEIMIMDEVLAVGDMKFQQKCLNKMNTVSRDEKRTILYVSHNMNTIRQLCNRCVVLQKGQVIFDGDVEKAISIYLNSAQDSGGAWNDLSNRDRPENSLNRIHMRSVAYMNADDSVVIRGTNLRLELVWEAKENLDHVKCRMIIRYRDDSAVGLVQSDDLGSFVTGQKVRSVFDFDTSMLAEGKYFLSIAFFQSDHLGGSVILDHVTRACSFEVVNDLEENKLLNWEHLYWGSVRFPDLVMIQEECQSL